MCAFRLSYQNLFQIRIFSVFLKIIIHCTDTYATILIGICSLRILQREKHKFSTIQYVTYPGAWNYHGNALPTFRERYFFSSKSVSTSNIMGIKQMYMTLWLIRNFVPIFGIFPVKRITFSHWFYELICLLLYFRLKVQVWYKIS